MMYLNSEPLFWGSRPQTLTVPLSGTLNPSRISTVLVLPAPFGPRRPNTSPSLTAKLTPRKASTSPYRLVRLLTSIVAPFNMSLNL